MRDSPHPHSHPRKSDGVGVIMNIPKLHAMYRPLGIRVCVCVGIESIEPQGQLINLPFSFGAGSTNASIRTRPAPTPILRL